MNLFVDKVWIAIRRIGNNNYTNNAYTEWSFHEAMIDGYSACLLFLWALQDQLSTTATVQPREEETEVLSVDGMYNLVLDKLIPGGQNGKKKWITVVMEIRKFITRCDVT